MSAKLEKLVTRIKFDTFENVYTQHHIGLYPMSKSYISAKAIKETLKDEEFVEIFIDIDDGEVMDTYLLVKTLSEETEQEKKQRELILQANIYNMKKCQYDTFLKLSQEIATWPPEELEEIKSKVKKTES